VLYILTETVFLSFLFIHYKENPVIIKRLIYIYAYVVWVFSIVYLLEKIFDDVLPSFRDSLDYFFSVDFLKDFILSLTSRIADFFVECIILFDNDVEFMYYKLIKWHGIYKRKKPYYIYIFKALYKKSKYIRN
jgi:hypothetical protein